MVHVWLRNFKVVMRTSVVKANLVVAVHKVKDVVGGRAGISKTARHADTHVCAHVHLIHLVSLVVFGNGLLEERELALQVPVLIVKSLIFTLKVADVLFKVNDLVFEDFHVVLLSVTHSGGAFTILYTFSGFSVLRWVVFVVVHHTIVNNGLVVLSDALSNNWRNSAAFFVVAELILNRSVLGGFFD